VIFFTVIPESFDRESGDYKGRLRLQAAFLIDRHFFQHSTLTVIPE